MRLKKREITTYIIAALIMVWLLVSYIEVITHNLEAGYVYSPFNAFQLFVDLLRR